ncbi:MAG: FkbM family methyltransferase [Solirubrobacteraceae bacterium]|jgi:ABC-2 type transport system ATP-binding protein
MGDRVFTEVSVAGAPPVLFCVDPQAGDPVAAWYLDHDWIDEPVQRAFLELVGPDLRVIDLGSHLGTFTLPAAALGASVLAVDATRAHVELLRAAAERNGFDRVQVHHRAISDSDAPVTFIERSIHGHVHPDTSSEPPPGAVAVAPATVDGLLEQAGWDDVDVIKMDIEGMETVALRGMARLHARGLRPAIVFECNGSMLPAARSSIVELRQRLVELGYELLMIDHLRPGTLVRVGPGAIQPECVCDYLALSPVPPELVGRWRTFPGFTREETIARLLDSAAGEGAGYRAYAASLLRHGPDWLRRVGAVQPALDALAVDRDAGVRHACARRSAAWPAVEHAGEPEPARGLRYADLRVWAEDLELNEPPPELERAPGDTHAGQGPPLLDCASLHVRPGQLVGLLSDRPAPASALLAALAGLLRPSAGELERDGRTVLVARIGEGLEPALSVGDNVALFGCFLGADVRLASGNAPRVAELVGLKDRLDDRLDALEPAEIALLAMAVALELAEPELLLIDRLPRLPAGGGRDWLGARVAQLCAHGGAVVQAVSDPDDLIAPADRAMWIAGNAIVASGHSASVTGARQRDGIGLARAARV